MNMVSERSKKIGNDRLFKLGNFVIKSSEDSFNCLYIAREEFLGMMSRNTKQSRRQGSLSFKYAFGGVYNV